MTESLAERVAASPAAELLPERVSREGALLPGSLRLIASEPLSARHVLAVLADTSGARFAAPLVVDEPRLRRARPGDGAAEHLLERLAGPQTGGSALRWSRTATRHRPVVGERAMGVDQTHESVVVGETAVVKWAVSASPSPAPVLLSHLHAAGFEEVPAPWGFVEHDGRLLVSVDRFLLGAEDGWTWCVADVGTAAVRGEVADLSPVAAMGDIVGRMHATLAELGTGDARASDVAGWRERAEAALDHALDVTKGEEGRRLRARRLAAARVINALSEVEAATTIHVHGDLHVGQVLRWAGGLAVTDFDGNPVLSPEDRLGREPAARDVAGMLQSLDHVGRVVVRRVEGADRAVVARWIRSARSVFLSAYREALTGRGAGGLLDDRLLLPFAVEQECREYAYAASHLPRWLYVPDASMAALLDDEGHDPARPDEE